MKLIINETELNYEFTTNVMPVNHILFGADGMVRCVKSDLEEVYGEVMEEITKRWPEEAEKMTHENSARNRECESDELYEDYNGPHHEACACKEVCHGPGDDIAYPPFTGSDDDIPF